MLYRLHGRLCGLRRAGAGTGTLWSMLCYRLGTYRDLLSYVHCSLVPYNIQRYPYRQSHRQYTECCGLSRY